MGDQTDQTAPPAADQGGTSHSIPKQRFDAVNTRMQAAEARAAELEAQLAERTKEPVPVPTARPVAPKPEAQPAPTPAVDKEKQKLQLMVDHQIPKAAGDAVFDLVSKGVDVDDAISLVQRKNPAAWGRDDRGFDQTAHSAAPPATQRPQPKPEATRTEKLAATRGNLNARSKMAVGFAADMVRGQIRTGTK